jgi:hypothetical protein
MRDQIATINTKPASLVASIANQTLAERTNQEVKVTLLDDAPKLTNDASATLLTLLRLSVDIKITPQTGNPVTYTMIFTSTDGTMVDARAGEAGYTTSLTQTMDAGTKKNTFVITVKDGESVPGASAVASDGAVTANTGTFTVPAGAKVEILSASLKNTNGEGEGLAVIPASVRIEKNSTINTDAITATLLTNALSKVDVFEITGAGTAANDAAQNVKFRMADIGKTLIEMVTNNGAQSEVKIALAGKADGSNSLELSEANVLTRAIETFVLQQRAEYTGSQTFNDQYTTGIAFDATQTIALTDQEVTDLVTAGRNLQLVLFVKDTFKNGETNTEILASTAVTLEHQVAEITTLSLVSPGELTSDSDFTLNGTATINYIDAAAPQPGFAVPTTLTTTLYVVPDERPTAEMNSSVYQETTLANKIAAAKSAGKDPLATRGVNLNDLGTGYKVATVVESLVDAGVYDIKTSENVLTNSIPFNFPTVPAKYFGKQLFAKSILTSTVSKGQTSDSSSTARTIERGDSRFTDTYLDEFTIGNGTGRYSNAALVKDLIAKESSLALGVGPTSQNARSEVSLPTNYTSLTNYGALNNTGPVGTIYTPNGFVVESALVVKSTTDAENIAFEALGSGELKAYNNRAANTIFKGTGIRDTVVFTGVNGATVPVQLNGKTAVNVVLGTTKWSDLLSPDNTGGSFKAAGQYYVADFEKNSANSLQWGTNFFGYKLSTTVYDNNNAALQSNGSDVTVVNGVDISGPTTSDKMKAFTSSFVETSIAGVTGAHWANTLGAALETAIVAGDVLQAAVGDTLTISNTEANAEKLALYIEAATPSPEPTEGIFAHGLVGNDNVLGNSQDPTGVLYLFSTPSSAETATTYLTIANDASNPTNYGLGTNATVTKTNATVTAKALANDGGDVIISS